MKTRNLFSEIPNEFRQENVETLLRTDTLTLERIVSSGQATPPGEWYDQEAHEWVILLRGQAGLLFEGEGEIQILQPGDYVRIPAHQRHRVEWTEAGQTTVWLALHFR